MNIERDFIERRRLERRALSRIISNGVKSMGNRFGNYASEQAAIDAIELEGFAPSTISAGIWRKASMTGGNLIEAPRDCIALVKIVHIPVNPEYGADYYQHEYL